MSVEHLTSSTATQEVLERIGDILLNGFKDDRILQLFAGESPEILRSMLTSRAKLAIDHKGLMIARDEGKITGVVVYDPPNVPSPKTFSGKDDSDFATVSPEINKWAKESFGPAMHKFMTDSFGEQGPLDSYYIAWLAVDPDTRGKGVGRRLMEAVISQAENAGAPTTLVNPLAVNVKIYNRIGFTVIQQAQVTLPAGDEGEQDFWSMERKPQSQ